MGAIAAVLNKRGENAVDTLVTMMKALEHRGNDAFGIASATSIVIAESLDEIASIKFTSDVVLGYNLTKILPTDKPQPISGKDFALVFEGRLYPLTSMPNINKMPEKFEHDAWLDAFNFVKKIEGSYVFALAQKNKIIAGRDFIGTCPLYFGENETLCCVASERKALWKVGINKVESFPPGNVATMSKKGFLFKQARTLTQPSVVKITMNAAAKQLQTLLLNSIRNRVSDINRVAVAFSGGLDSSIVAVLAKKCGIDVHLVSVSLESQHEIQEVKTAAKALKLPLHLQTYTLKDLKEVLPKILWLIEEANAVKVSIATPLFWTAETAAKLGFKVLLAGQGSDELFGGYRRYLEVYSKLGVFELKKILHHDVAISYETNFQRDNQVCSLHKVELRLPFTDSNLVNFALSLPVNLKIASQDDSSRKIVLRQVAQNLKMPSFIVNKAKRAIQYTTGVNKALKKLAKKEKLSLRNYVNNIFRKVYKEVKNTK